MLAVRLGDRRFSLRQAQSFVGRSRSCDITIRSQGVSRLNSLLYWHNGELKIDDLGSVNGTFVNGLRISATRSLKPGDRVSFGDVAGEIVLEPLGRKPSAVSDSIPLSYPMLRPCPLVRRILASVADLVFFLLGSAVPLLPILSAAFLVRHRLVPEWLPLDLQVRSILAGVSMVLWFMYLWAYVIHAWGKVGATPGMRMLGLKLVDWRGRYPVGYARACLRAAALAVTLLSLGLGFLVSLFRKDRRTLHDLLAGTWVAWNPFAGVGSGPGGS